jgi:hypothetical protein
LPRIAIVPQKINLDPRHDEDIIAGRDLEGTLGAIATRAKAIMLLMRPDRYVALALRIEGAQTPASFIETARRMVATTRS